MELKNSTEKIIKKINEELENEIKQKCTVVLNKDITVKNINEEVYKYLKENYIKRNELMIILNEDGWGQLMNDIKPYIRQKNENIDDMTLSGIDVEKRQIDEKCVILNMKRSKKIISKYNIFP